MSQKISKSNFWLAVGFSAFGALNVVIYGILAACSVVAFKWMYLLFAAGYLICVWVPVLLELWTKARFQIATIVSYDIFLVLSILVGSVWRVYDSFKGYDKIVHTSSGIFIALISYSLFKNSKKSNHLSAFWLFVFVFSVAMMCGGVWEIWEYVTDGILGNNAQNYVDQFERAALWDSMTDLICDFCGAIVGGVAVVLLDKKSVKIEDVKQEQSSVQNDASAQDLDAQSGDTSGQN